MSTDVALRGDSTALMTLTDWAAELDAAYTIAQKLCVTAFCPAHFKGKPAEAAAAILTGHELGLTPMAALRSIFMISGTPGMYAKVMVAVAQSRGHQVWVAEQSDERVVVKGKRKGEAETYETVWDPARVKLAGLETNAKYRTNKQQMMVARGQAEIARQVAADALHGIPYSVEELEDMPPVRATATVTSRASARAILDHARAEALEVPHENVMATAATDDPEPVEIGDAPPAMTTAQGRKLYALLKDTDRADRDEGLRYLSLLLGREVTSTKTLTKDEATTAIDSLDRELAGEGGLPASDELPLDGA